MNRITYCCLRSTLLFAVTLILSAPALAQYQNVSEQSLIETLRSAEPAEKAIACKQLAIFGTKESVPELAKLLSDERLASWARIALEAIPDEAAGEALRTALDGLEGNLLVGCINSIGVRKDAAAVEALTNRLQHEEAAVASAAAVALGHIGNSAATEALGKALTSGDSEEVRSAVAEGFILCAERLLNEGDAQKAADIYDQVREAQVPQQRIVEATRGAILARGKDGIPLLLEQLRSEDNKLLQIGLMTARELDAAGVADALAAEMANTTAERAALLLYALADRKDAVVPPAVVDVARSGDKPVRIAAIEFIGRAGTESSLDALLEIATESDPEIVQAAKTALAALPGDSVNAEIVALLGKAQGNVLPVLIELVGLRRIDATEALVKALENDEPAVRRAALAALGTTAGPEQLAVLIQAVVAAKDAEEAEVARRALQEAAVRMPDPDECANQIAAALETAPQAAKASLLEILGAIGGQSALDSIAVVMKSGNTELQDVGSRLLGEWMSVDAGPVLLDIAKSSTNDKYRGRAIRGYIRLARQFRMPDAQRAEMCQAALEAAKRPEERQLVLVVLDRYPSIEMLRVVLQAAEQRELKEDATLIALKTVQTLGDSPEARELLSKLGFKPVKVEIVKAQYGAGNQHKDVTDVLQQAAGEWPLIVLPGDNYNETFGGDPAPGTRKELKVQYRIDGKEGEATFAENAPVLLR